MSVIVDFTERKAARKAALDRVVSDSLYEQWYQSFSPELQEIFVLLSAGQLVLTAGSTDQDLKSVIFAMDSLADMGLTVATRTGGTISHDTTAIGRQFCAAFQRPLAAEPARDSVA